MKTSLLALLLFLTLPLFGEPPDGEAPPPIEIQGSEGPEKVFLPKKGPPIEAMEACQNKKRNAGCTFLGKKGEDAVRISGYCWSPSPKAPLACRPEDPELPPRPKKSKPK